MPQSTVPLTKEDLLNKLAQIQEQAQLTLDELPVRLAKDRLRLIVGLAKYLRTGIDMGTADPLPPAPPEAPLGDKPLAR